MKSQTLSWKRGEMLYFCYEWSLTVWFWDRLSSCSTVGSSFLQLSSRDPPVHCACPSCCATGSKTHEAHSKYSSGMLWKVRRVDLQDTHCICFRGSRKYNWFVHWLTLSQPGVGNTESSCNIDTTNYFPQYFKDSVGSNRIYMCPLATKWRKKVPWWGIQSHH